MMMHTGRAAAALMLMMPLIAGAQGAAVSVPDAVACAECRIEYRTIIVLGGAGPGELSTTPNGITIDGRGRYWITQEAELPMVFDSTGRFLQTVGARGSGPGEFQFAHSPIPVAGDSVIIPDFGRAVIVAPDLRPARSFRVPNGIRLAVVAEWPGRLLAVRSGYDRDPSQPAVLSMTVTGAEAEVAAEFRPVRGSTDVQAPQMHVLGRAVRGGTVWSGDGGTGGRYGMSRWSVAGTPMASLERRPAWLADADGQGFPPALTALADAGDGTLWTFVSIRRDNWRDGMPPIAPGQREVAARSIAMEKVFRTVVEAIDPRAGRVVARTDLNEWVIAALPRDRAAIYTVDADGFPRVKIVEFFVARSRSQSPRANVRR